MAEWIVFGAIVLLAIVGTLYLFRSLRRWQHPVPRSAEAKQAEMHLLSESHLTDRW